MRRAGGAIFSVGLAVLAAAAAACRSDPPGGPSPGASCATITIANNTVSPASVTVNRGCQVTFTNNDSRGHTMSSDPHPEHTECPEINVGTIGGSQSRQTQNLNTARTCGFHDHDLPDVAGLKGRITIQ